MITPPTSQQMREFQSGPSMAWMEVVKYLDEQNEPLIGDLKQITDHDHLMRVQGAAQVVSVILWALQATPSDGKV